MSGFENLPLEVPPIDVYRGDTVEWSVEVADESGPLDLTGYTWLCQWRSRVDAGPSVPVAVDSSLANVGQFSFTLSAEQTAEMDRGGIWDLQGTFTSGKVTTWLKGSTVLQKDVTV